MRSRQRSGQDVVPVRPLVSGLVDLDHVLEAENTTHECAIPEQVVERREQHGGGRARRVELRAGGNEHVGPALVGAQPLDLAVIDECVDRRPYAGDTAPQAPVLDHSGLGQHAARSDGAQGELAEPRLVVWLGCFENGASG